MQQLHTRTRRNTLVYWYLHNAHGTVSSIYYLCFYYVGGARTGAIVQIIVNGKCNTSEFGAHLKWHRRKIRRRRWYCLHSADELEHVCMQRGRPYKIRAKKTIYMKSCIQLEWVASEQKKTHCVREEWNEDDRRRGTLATLYLLRPIVIPSYLLPHIDRWQ